MLQESLLPSAPRPSSFWHTLQQQALLIATASFISLLCLVNAASFGMLILPASSGLPSAAGVPIFLMSTITSMAALSLSSGVPFACGGATIEVVPLMAPIAQLVNSCHSQHEKASTLLVMLASTSLLVGIFYTVVSRLRLGRIFRSIPLIVLKSALTGVGVFIIIESAKMGVGVVEADADREAEPLLAQLLGPTGWPKLLTTALLYAGLAVVQCRTSSPFATLGYLSCAVALLAALRASGLLVLSHGWYFGTDGDAGDAGGEAGGGSASMFGLLPLFSLAHVSVPTLLAAAPYALSCTFVHVLVSVTDLVALESAASGSGFSLDREMGAIGLANLLAGCLGTMPCYIQLSPSVVALRFVGSGGGGDGGATTGGSACGGAKGGAATPSAVCGASGASGASGACGTCGACGARGLRVCSYAALITAVLLPLLDDVVSAVPRPVVAAFLLDMGVGFVLEAGVHTLRRTVSLFDQLMLALVPLLMLLLGFLPGLALGLVLALLHFIIIYSALPIVRWQQTGRELRSNTVRPMACAQALEVRAHHNITIISLQGFVMFGSVPQLGDALDALLARRAACEARHAHEPSLHAPPWFVLVDLRRCSGVDFGGAQQLCSMHANVRQHGGELRFAGPSAFVAAAIDAASSRGPCGALGPFLPFDDELRRAENEILAAHGPPAPDLQSVAVDLPTARSIRLGFTKTHPGDHEAVVTALTQHVGVGASHVAAAAKLLELGEIRQVARGERLWAERDEASFYVLVLAGALTLTRHGHVIEGAVPGSMAGFLFCLERDGGDGGGGGGGEVGAVRDTSLSCASATARVLVISRQLSSTIQRHHAELERLLVRGFLARAAAEYRHWIRHESIAGIEDDGGAAHESVACADDGQSAREEP